ncbi:MAG: hypothetical protein KGL75_05210 [Acidobacteriota bacterium]|nr:hypothetical protein [Acidobacteriota bacterium]
MNDKEFSYRILNLEVRSNAPLPAVRTTPAVLEPDLTLHFGDFPQALGEPARNADLFYSSTILLDSGEPAFRIWKLAERGTYRIDYFDGTKFWIETDTGNIWADWLEKSSFEDAASYFLGPVMGFVLRMRGVTCLHASAVAIDGRAAAFVGPTGSGKSTTAAGLSLRGHAVVSDDIVALSEMDGRFYAAPAYPYVMLWPEAVEALCGAGKILPAVSNNFEKRRLSIDADRFSGKSVALKAIFMLGERTGEPAAPWIEEIAPREALVSLVANTYANLLLDDAMRAREFEILGRLVNAVPVWRIRAHQDPARIGEFCGLIERELTGRESAAEASMDDMGRSRAAGRS